MPRESPSPEVFQELAGWAFFWDDLEIVNSPFVPGVGLDHPFSRDNSVNGFEENNENML